MDKRRRAYGVNCPSTSFPKHGARDYQRSRSAETDKTEFLGRDCESSDSEEQFLCPVRSLECYLNVLPSTGLRNRRDTSSLIAEGQHGILRDRLAHVISKKQ